MLIVEDLFIYLVNGYLQSDFSDKNTVYIFVLHTNYCGYTSEKTSKTDTINFLSKIPLPCVLDCP